MGLTMLACHLAHHCMFLFSLTYNLFTNEYFYLESSTATTYDAIVMTLQGVGDGQMSQTM